MICKYKNENLNRLLWSSHEVTEISLDDLACSRLSAFCVRIVESGAKQESREKNKEEERTRLPRFSPPAPPRSCFSCTLLLRAVFAIWTLGTGSLEVQSLKGALTAKRISAIHSASEKTPAKILSHAYLKCIMFGNLSNCNLQRLADMILRAIQTQNKAWPADPLDGTIREKSLRLFSEFSTCVTRWLHVVAMCEVIRVFCDNFTLRQENIYNNKINAKWVPQNLKAPNGNLWQLLRDGN